MGLALVCSSSWSPPLYLVSWALKAQGGCLSGMLCATSSLALTAKPLEPCQKWPLPRNKAAHSHGKLRGTPRVAHCHHSFVVKGRTEQHSGRGTGVCLALDTVVFSELFSLFQALLGGKETSRLETWRKEQGPSSMLQSSTLLANRSPWAFLTQQLKSNLQPGHTRRPALCPVHF